MTADDFATGLGAGAGPPSVERKDGVHVSWRSWRHVCFAVTVPVGATALGASVVAAAEGVSVVATTGGAAGSTPRGCLGEAIADLRLTGELKQNKL